MLVSRWKGRSRRPLGFTLIELLVVISIIGVLASLILPGIMSARAAARRTQCLNNMRNIGTAVFEYATSNRRFPPSGVYHISDAEVTTWGDTLAAPTPNAGYGPATLTTAASYTATIATASRMKYSWVRELLSRLDRSDISDAWDTSYATAYGTYLWNGTTASGKRNPFPASGGPPGLSQVDLRVFSCPDDITVVRGQGNLSYVVNSGFSPHPTLLPDWSNIPTGTSDSQYLRNNLQRMGLMFLQVFTVQSAPAANAVPAITELTGNYRHTIDTVKDGLTTTIMLSENINAGYQQSITPLGRSGVTSGSVAEINWACPHPGNTSFFVQAPLPGLDHTSNANAGVIVQGAAGTPSYTTAYNYANSNPRSLTGGGINSNLSGAESAFPFPNSFHTGGVNIVMCDGSTRFMPETVDARVWARLVTPDGGRLLGPKTGTTWPSVFEDAATAGNRQIPLSEQDIQ